TDGSFNWRNHSAGEFRTLQMFASNPITSTGTTYRYNLRGDLQIEFYNIACTNPINAGTTVASVSTPVCPNTNVDLSLTGNDMGSGMIYEWESAPTNTEGSYTSIAASQTTV